MKYNTPPFEKSFNAALFDCIDEALTSVLGKSVVSALYYAIQESFHFPKDEFSEKPLDILHDLEIFLGESGFKILEKRIVNQMKETFEITESYSDLVQATGIARVKYIQRDFDRLKLQD